MISWTLHQIMKPEIFGIDPGRYDEEDPFHMLNDISKEYDKYKGVSDLIVERLRAIHKKPYEPEIAVNLAIEIIIYT